MLVDVGVTEEFRELKTSAAVDGGFEGLQGLLELSGVAFGVMEGIPGVQGEEGQETDAKDEIAGSHYDL